MRVIRINLVPDSMPANCRKIYFSLVYMIKIEKDLLYMKGIFKIGFQFLATILQQFYCFSSNLPYNWGGGHLIVLYFVYYLWLCKFHRCFHLLWDGRGMPSRRIFINIITFPLRKWINNLSTLLNHLLLLFLLWRLRISLNNQFYISSLLVNILLMYLLKLNLIIDICWVPESWLLLLVYL